MNEYVRNTGHFIFEEAKKTLARAFIWIIITLALFILTPLWDRLKIIWRSTEDIAAIKNDLHQLQQDLNGLRIDVARANGEDRVIRQLPGLSYVAEPVYRGDPVVLYLTIQRTRLGAYCQLVEAVSLFTDFSGATISSSISSLVHPFGTDPVRLRLVLQQPSGLLAGRIELYLLLQYDCNGVKILDRTDTVVYNLIERTE